MGIAVAPLHQDRVVVLGDDAAAHGWSTTKVPVLAALLKARGMHGLTEAERGQATLAITESDNQSIVDLFDGLESLKGGLVSASRYIDLLFRHAGDNRTVVATSPPPPGAVTTFGQTLWSPSESVKFFQALGAGCLLSAAQTKFVLGLMERVIPSESWGLGDAGFEHHAAFKGGWGPEYGDGGAYLVRQSGIVDPDSQRGLAVSIVAHPPGGPSSFELGVQMVSSAARWLKRELVLAPRVGAGCPG